MSQGVIVQDVVLHIEHMLPNAGAFLLTHAGSGVEQTLLVNARLEMVVEELAGLEKGHKGLIRVNELETQPEHESLVTLSPLLQHLLPLLLPVNLLISFSQHIILSLSCLKFGYQLPCAGLVKGVLIGKVHDNAVAILNGHAEVSKVLDEESKGVEEDVAVDSFGFFFVESGGDEAAHEFAEAPAGAAGFFFFFFGEDLAFVFDNFHYPLSPF